MTYIENGVLVIDPEEPDTCELCGKMDELRPYGPGGKRICYGCSLKDPQTTLKMFQARMTDAGVIACVPTQACFGSAPQPTRRRRSRGGRNGSRR